jgi:putative oxidoreductase
MRTASKVSIKPKPKSFCSGVFPPMQEVRMPEVSVKKMRDVRNGACYQHGMNLFNRIASTQAPRATVLIRIMVGGVFLSEGMQKFLFPAEVGAGRFAKIGLPSPEFLGAFVGSFEIACGVLVLLGLLTRLAAIPLIVIMCVAIYTTKIPILLELGFWKMAHASRNDYAMLTGALFLLIVGAGIWSVDAWLARRRGAPGAGRGGA